MSAAPDKRERARDLDAEQEIDLGRLWRATIARWWLLLIGFVAGAIIGLLVSLGGGKQWKATTEIYLGQPLSPTSSSAISSPPTSLGLATTFVNSESALVAPVSAHFGVKMSYAVRYNSRPPVKFGTTDRVLTTGVQLSL